MWPDNSYCQLSIILTEDVRTLQKFVPSHKPRPSSDLPWFIDAVNSAKARPMSRIHFQSHQCLISAGFLSERNNQMQTNKLQQNSSFWHRILMYMAFHLALFYGICFHLFHLRMYKGLLERWDTCRLNLCPAWLIKKAKRELWDWLLPIINCSVLTLGSDADKPQGGNALASFEENVRYPYNFQPVFNLPFLGRVLKHIVASQLHWYLDDRFSRSFSIGHWLWCGSCPWSPSWTTWGVPF